MNILVIATGYIGDILFSSSLAKKLKQLYYGSMVYYSIPLIQPLLLLKQNPHIDGVIIGQPDNIKIYDKIFIMPEVRQDVPATICFQMSANIPEEYQSVEYQVYTIPKYDREAEYMIESLRKEYSYKRIVGYQVDFAWKAYQSTKDTLIAGIGAPHRNQEMIIDKLKEHFTLVPIGFDRSVPQQDSRASNAESYAKAASIIKYCDVFFGAEGGLTNLSAGVGTKTIILTDFIAQQYWKNGRIRKYGVPKMGPATYFPSRHHSHIHPCISDNEIPDKLIDLINNNRHEVFNWDISLDNL